MAKILEARAVISATDATGSAFERVASKIRALQQAAKAVSGVGVPLAAASQRVEAVSRRITAVGRGMSAGVTLPAAFAAKRGYSTVLEYEKELNKAQALGELSAEQRKVVDRDSRDIGRDTQFKAMQALQMMRTYIQAGRSFEQARGMTKPTLDFALFGDVDPKTAADTITAVASAYRLAMGTLDEARQSATRVGDTIAKAANISRADVGDLAQGFKYAAPMAKIAGMEMEELAGAIATMSNNGQRGDEAGVALRSMLVRMVAPTRKSTAAMKELGLSFEQFSKYKDLDLDTMISSLEQSGISAKPHRDALGKITSRKDLSRGDMIPELVDVIAKAGGEGSDTPTNREAIADAVGAYLLANTERIDVKGLVKALIENQASAGQLARIFDQRQGSRIATLLTPDFFKNVETLRKEAPGASERGARIMEQGLYGSHQRFLSAGENFILSLAKSGVIDNVSKMLDGMAVRINSLAESNPKMLEFGTYAVAAAAAIGPLALGLGLLGRSISGLLKVVGFLLPGAAVAGAAAASKTAAGAIAMGAGRAAGAGPLGLLAAGVAAGHYLTPDDAVAAEKRKSHALRLQDAYRSRFNDERSRDGVQPVGGLQPLTVEGVRQAVEGASVTAKVEGNADLNVNVKVEPSADFISRINTTINNAINAFRSTGTRSTGSTGSTGASMPEAGTVSP